MKEISKKYGFITATAMIVGICIGSGIFFKSDNILIATGWALFCLLYRRFPSFLVV